MSGQMPTQRKPRNLEGGMRTVAVVGVTGTIGARVAHALAEAGHQVIGLSRNPGRSAAGRIVAVDLRNEAAAAAALAGADAVYLTPPMAGENPLADEQAVVRSVIAAAARTGVAHIVMHTALHADRGNTGARILDNKTPLEVALRNSDVPFSILRPAWYLQNLFGAKPWLDQGMFSMPWPADRVWAATDVNDVVRAAVALIERGPTNRAFDVHQPGGVSAAAIGRAVQTVTGRTIGYQEFPGGTRAAVDGYPLSDVHKELYAELFDYFRRETFLGEPLAIADEIPGFAYRTLEDFVRRELYPPTDGVTPSTHSEERAMFVMAIKHKVRDYATWKSAYDAFPPTAAGATFSRVNRATDDPNEVLVVTGWNAEKDAKAFTSNPELGKAMATAGVIGAPRFEVYEQVEVTAG
ncbi:MAG TPA: NAD(P)H-binding protein [Gemmatimonadaceae bacterium]|nr:NAD(P)H-binding protein [Gemmatimonadaceae bacterium]